MQFGWLCYPCHAGQLISVFLLPKNASLARGGQLHRTSTLQAERSD
jgi:hypothetical protein